MGALGHRLLIARFHRLLHRPPQYPRRTQSWPRHIARQHLILVPSPLVGQGARSTEPAAPKTQAGTRSRDRARRQAANRLAFSPSCQDIDQGPAGGSMSRNADASDPHRLGVPRVQANCRCRAMLPVPRTGVRFLHAGRRVCAVRHRPSKSDS